MTLRRTIRHTLAAAGLLLAAAQAARPATAVPPSAGADGRSVPVREAAAGRTPQRSGGMQRAATGRPAAERTVGIAFYDVDRLYDTLPALFYDDEEYTPRGRLRWTAERYARKIRNTAAVIDSMALPVVALRGVENERVVRDLAAACRGDYSYLHRTLNTLDGLDFALLYYGDLFDPHYEEPGRRYLYIEGTLRFPAPRTRRTTGRPVRPARTDTVGLVLCSDTRMAEWVVRDLREERPGVKLIVLGRTASLDAAAYGLRDALERPARLGRGNVRRRGGWLMRDRILTDTALICSGGDVFAPAAICLIPRRVTRSRPTRDGVTGAASATPCRYSFTWSRIFWNFRKVFLYSHSQRQIGFFDEAVTAMSPQFSSVGEEIS